MVTSNAPPPWPVLAATLMLSLAAPASAQSPAPIFADDFENGLEGWSFPLGEGHGLVDAGGDRGTVLEMRVADRPVHALIAGSQRWRGVRLEGMVSFPDDVDNYLGFIFGYRDSGRRIDFGSLYIKGNGSYVQANVHQDTNVGRTWQPELRTALTGARRIEIGAWHRFALEVVDGRVHLYVVDMETPAMTMRYERAEGGAFGFKPRNPGGAVRIDDVRALPIDRPSYAGGPVPASDYRPDQWITEWSVLGPLSSHSEAVESGHPIDRSRPVDDDGRSVAWQPYASDHRGAVLTGAVTEFRGARRVAYFHAVVDSDADRDAELVVSSVDDLAIWLNGAFVGFGAGRNAAWFDTAENPERPATRADVRLTAGANELLVRVVGGVYASGAFYMTVRAPAG